MGAVEHRLVRKPRGFRGKVRGGVVVGCSCNAVTIVGTVQQGIRWHAEHRKQPTGPAVVQPVDALRERLDTLTAQFATVTGG